MSGLRILHAVRSDGFAGVEQFILRLADAQARRGDHVHVIGGAPDRMVPELASAGVGYTPAARSMEVMRAVRRLRPAVDVVNSHMSAADAAVAAAMRGRCHRPAVVSTRHFASARGRIGPISIDRVVAAHIDAEVAISAAVAASTGVPSVVVHPGLSDRAAGVWNARRPVVLMAQRLQPEKRTVLGVEIFARSGVAADGWELHIAGDGPDRVPAGSAAADYGISDAVRFLGNRSDLPDIMDRCGILLAPCDIEGLGLAVLEAMRSGLAVVAANAGGHTELLEGLDGTALFPSDDIDAAAAGLSALARDAGRRRSLAVAARDRQRAAFTLDAWVRGTDAVYRTVIAARGGVEAGR